MSKFNALLADLEEAFNLAQEASDALAMRRQEAADAIQEQQDALDAVKAVHGSYVTAAEEAANDARVALDRARQAANDFSGTLLGVNADPRVSVR